MVSPSSPLLEAVQHPLYLDDTYLTEVVTRVAAVRSDAGEVQVAVRDNLFHPQGGGQPADRGWIGDREVTPVLGTDGLVYLRSAVPRTELGEDDVVLTRIDAGLRLLHAALHTAGHLVEGVARAEGWMMAGSNHFPGQARIEFTLGTGPDLADIALRAEMSGRIQAAVDAAIADVLGVTATESPDGRRVVRIGDLHEAPCGGTHVRSLADLADVTISGLKQKKGRIRVSYTASHRPLA